MRADLQKDTNGIQYYLCDYSFSKKSGFNGVLDLIEKNGNLIKIYKGENKNGKTAYSKLPTEVFNIIGDGLEQLRGKLDIDNDGKADDANFGKCPHGNPSLNFILRPEAVIALYKKYDLGGRADINGDGLADDLVILSEQGVQKFGVASIHASDRRPD